jgi:hypothetical protein
MCVNSGDLRRCVGSQSHQSTRNLIDQFEGLKIKGFARASEQRLNVFKQGRRHQFKAIASGCV